MRNADTVALIKHNLQKAIIQAVALLDIQQHFGAVNRAYYAIFYAALAILLTKDLGSSKHSGILSLFDREFVKTNEVDRKWSKIFHDSFGLRATGDYARLADVTVQQAAQAIQNAEEFASWAREWLSEREWL